MEEKQENLTLLKRLQRLGLHLLYFARWLLRSLAIGLIGGLVGTIFHACIGVVTEVREENPGLIIFLPCIGLVIVFLYHLAGMKNDRGTNMVLDSIHTDQHLPSKMAPLIFVGTLLTHLGGGSSGRESAALQIGGSIGSSLGDELNLDEKDRQVLVMCGMTAVFTAMFGTPLTATIFSMEVVSVGIIYYSAFVPCIISATAAYGLSQGLGVEATRYTINIGYSIPLTMCFKVILLAICCGLVGILFCVALHQVAHLTKRWIRNDYGRVFVGGVIVIVLTILEGSGSYNGAGTEMIKQALSASVPPTAFLWKILFTSVTIGTGYKGGEIVPSLFVGAALGNFLGPVIGVNSSYAAAICMVAMFCAVVNCPVTSVILGLELFGRTDLLLFAIACSVSYVFSGYYSLYSSQKIVHSKTRPEYINRRTL